MSILRTVLSFVVAATLVAATLPGDDVVSGQLPVYPLSTCVVSGEALGGMGDTVDQVHEGRLVRFCCKGCIKEFDKDPAAHIAKLDKAVVRAQMAHYPTQACLLSGEVLDEDAIDVVHDSRLVRLCCRMCQKEMRKDPDMVMAKLDEAYIAAQLETYPLAACPVSGEALDDDAKNVLYGNRLVRLCCNGCKKEFAKAPAMVVAQLDRAAKAAGRGHDDDRGHEGRDGDHGHGDHDGRDGDRGGRDGGRDG